jgi:hypothetical protein
MPLTVRKPHGEAHPHDFLMECSRNPHATHTRLRCASQEVRRSIPLSPLPRRVINARKRAIINKRSTTSPSLEGREADRSRTGAHDRSSVPGRALPGHGGHASAR